MICRKHSPDQYCHLQGMFWKALVADGRCNKHRWSLQIVPFLANIAE